MNKVQTLSYSKGMDQDTSVSKRDPNTYYEALNMRLLSDESNDAGNMSNIKGLASKFTFLNANEELKGYCNLGDSVILFTRDSGTNYSYIYQFIDDGTDVVQNPSDTSYPNTTGDYRLIYKDAAFTSLNRLNLITNTRCIGRVESNTIQKVYFVDGLHSLRSINIIYNANTNPLDTYTQSDFNIISDIAHVKPTFNSFGSGNLTSGVYCYAYQLYNLYKNESSFSPTSDLIPLTEYMVDGNTEDLRGSEADVNTGKSVVIDVASIDNSFDRIKVVAIEFKDDTLDPTIRIVSDQKYNSSSIKVIDSGKSLGNLTLEQFRILNTIDIIPDLIETKNNYLLLGNVKTEEFDLDEELGDIWDSRIYKFNSARDAKIYDGTGWNNVTDLELNIDGTSPTYPDTVTELEFNAINPNNDINNDQVISGVHDGGDGQTSMEDSSLTMSSGDYVGWTIYNLTKGESAIITSTTSITASGTLSGGADWDDNDVFHISPTFNYQLDGSTLGASGPNITLEYVSTAYKIDDNGTGTEGIKTLNTAITSDNEDWIYGINRGYRRDEIYRFGIIFYDKKGRRSKPKWIADIRMPSISTGVTGFPLTTYGASNINAYALNPKFTISNCPTIDGSTLKWQIVRLPRTDIDKTILAQGIGAATTENVTHSGVYESCFEMTDVADYVAGNYFASMSDQDNKVLHQSLFEFISPEINFSNNFKRGERLSFEGSVWKSDKGNAHAHSNITFNDSTSGTWIDNSVTQSDFNGDWAYQIIRKSFLSGVNETMQYHIPISDVLKVSQSDKDLGIKYTVGGVTYSNYNLREDSPADHGGLGNTKAIIKTGTFFSNLAGALGGVSSKNDKLMLLNYKKTIIPYGGNTYEDRVNNQYIQASDLQNGNNSRTSYNGDTFICFFDYLRTTWDEARSNSPATKIQEVCYWPIETDFNLFFREDSSWNKLRNFPDTENRHLAEEGYIDASTGISFPPLYQYNKVYNRENNSIIDITPLSTVNTNNEFSTRIHNSDKKINGELIDSWLQFKIDNFIDVDSQFGELTRLINHKNNILFLQPKAIGWVSIEQREVLQSQNETSLVLGTGEVLDRFDYLDNKTGCSNYEGVIQSDTQLYFYDILKKKFNLFEGISKPLSIIKGMNSWFKSKSPSDVLGSFDPYYNEILLTLDNETIVYDEILACFRYLYDINPNIYIQTYNQLYHSVDLKTGYAHNIGEYNKKYSTYTIPYITYLSNPVKHASVSFNNIDWISVVKGTYATSGRTIGISDRKIVEYDGTGTGVAGHYYMNIDGRTINITGSTDYTDTTNWQDLGIQNTIPFETFTSVDFWNSFQNTDTVTLTKASTMDKRFNQWSLAIPRDNEINKYINSRMTDTHLFIKFFYNNDDNFQLLMNDINIKYNI